MNLMCTLITMVGQQPAAIATTAKTLLHKKGLQRVILLPTEQTENEAKCLVAYLCDNLNMDQSKIETCYICTDPEKTSNGYEKAWDAIKRYLDQNNLPQPVYFDLSPGLNYQVALISHHFKNDDRFQPLYADNKTLRNLTTGESMELEHIGFENLLKLYGLHEKCNKREGNPGDIIPAVTICGGQAGLTLPLVYACERHGRFYGLYKIWKNSTEINADRVKNEARMLESILQAPKRLNNLHPQLAVWTKDRSVKYRLEAYDVKVFSLTEDNQEKALGQWEQLIRQILENQNPTADDAAAETREKPNGTWSGQNLVIVLGSDPASTAKAIFSHKPRELIILYDPQTKWIRMMAGRLKTLAKEYIHAQKTTFMPWWILNSNAPTPPVIPEDYIANITPGTKLDAWRLARLNVQGLYSLNNVQQKAVSLLPGDHKTYDYDLPPILFTAQLHQGNLMNDAGGNPAGVSNQEIQNKKSFLGAMINVIAKLPDNTALDTPWQVDNKMGNKTDYIVCTQTDEINHKLFFNVFHNGQNPLTGDVGAQKFDGGFWLEEPVTGAFSRAGGTKIKDIRVGVKWPWQDNQSVQRTEIDCVIIWKYHYICISCKTGARQRNENILTETINEIAAEARAGFGRFAIPVIVRGHIAKDIAKAVCTKSLEKHGVLQIGLSILNQPNTLNELIDKAIKEYQTLAE